ncbi:MAG: sensor histidine kinase [Candidatus Dormibacteria bacterium]
MSSTEPRVPWHQSLRWRLSLSFVALLAILLTVAGGIEYSLLRQAIISSRAQTLEANFTNARSLIVRLQVERLAHHRPRLTPAALAHDLADQIALARVSAVVVSPSLRILASAKPGNPPGPQVVPGAKVALASRSALLAAAQFDTRGAPTLISNASTNSLVMVFPLATASGRDLGAVELAESAAPIDQELGTAALVLALGSIAVLLLALITGLLLTARSLRPLRRLTATAEALGGGDLSQRSGLPPRRDEVGVLAGVFDEMAGSVERTVRLREEAERQMRQFIADASHELRTPLTVIKGYLEVLQRGGGADAETVRKALPTMSQQAERMRHLVTDLLTLARADAQRTILSRPLPLDQFLDEFLDERPGPVERDLGAGLVALADPDALLTVCGNLQNNAERHGEGRAVRWSTVDQGDRVGFCCSDQGPGIDERDLPHLFERFYRAGAARSRQDGGSGLGLAIVQSLVEAMGGSVGVESGPGQGARFTVLLRRARASDWTSP